MNPFNPTENSSAQNGASRVSRGGSEHWGKKHMVERGQDLETIAQQHSVEPRDIIDNNLHLIRSARDIRFGMNLSIPNTANLVDTADAANTSEATATEDKPASESEVVSAAKFLIAEMSALVEKEKLEAINNKIDALELSAEIKFLSGDTLDTQEQKELRKLISERDALQDI